MSGSNQAILVLGPHRSGTSAVTRVLNLLGAKVPGNLLPASHLNQRGFWESVDVIRVDDDALAVAGVAWHDFKRIPPSVWDEREPWERGEAEIQTILARDFRQESLLLIKDPRICRLVPLWARALRRHGIEPRFVLVVRHPVEAAASLLEAQAIHPARGLVLWLRSVLDAELHSRGFPRSFVSFTGLLEDWKACVSRVSRDLGVEWPVEVGEIAGEIETFLSAGLRHHVASTEADATGSWIGSVYDAFERAARDEDFDPSPTLDDVRSQLDAAEEVLTPEVFAPILRIQLDALDRRCRELESSLGVVTGERDEAREQVLAAREEVAALAEHRDALTSELVSARQDMERASGQRDEIGEAKAVIEGRLVAEEGARAAVQAQLDAVTTSRSWRLTGPLRRLRAMLFGE